MRRVAKKWATNRCILLSAGDFELLSQQQRKQFKCVAKCCTRPDSTRFDFGRHHTDEVSTYRCSLWNRRMDCGIGIVASSKLDCQYEASSTCPLKISRKQLSLSRLAESQSLMAPPAVPLDAVSPLCTLHTALYTPLSAPLFTCHSIRQCSVCAITYADQQLCDSLKQNVFIQTHWALRWH